MEAIANCGTGLAEALNAHTYGNGSQTIVLSYGIGGDQNIWHYLVPALAVFFKVLVYDLAFSPDVSPKLYNPVRYSNVSAYAQDLTCILDELKIKKSILVGHSLSGMMGCIAATKRPDLFKHLVLLNSSPTKRPDLFKHLVLLNSSPRYLNDKRYKGGFTQGQLDSSFNIIKNNFTGVVPGFARQGVGVNNTAAIAEIECNLLRLGSERALSTGRTGFLMDTRRFLPYVRVPVTIIQSEKDFSVPKPVPFYMKRRLWRAPSVNVRILKANGHYPMLTHPYRLLSILKEALGISKM